MSDPALTRTSIHAALGEDEPLDHAMIVRAVEAGVGEGQGLDWKSVHYTGADPGGEFAKDVAAFANSRGGLIVLGVTEERRTGRAIGVNPVEVSDGTVRKYRSWIATRVTPTLHDVHIVSLPGPDDPENGFLVISVPASVNTPHMVGGEGSGGYPVRMGTQTHWLREFDIERAYQDRFGRRRDDHEALTDLIAHVREGLDRTANGWVIGASRPSAPFPAWTGAPTRDEARAILDAVGRSQGALVPQTVRASSVLENLHGEASNPRVGLRRWVVSPREDAPTPSGLAGGSVIEIHHDGSVVVALSTDWHPQERLEGAHVLPDFVLHAVVNDLVSAAHALEEQRGIRGAHLLRVEHARADSEMIGFIAAATGNRSRYDFPGGSREMDGSCRLRRLRPVETVAPRLAEVDERREVVQTLVTDVVSQFGAELDDFGYAWPPDDAV